MLRHLSEAKVAAACNQKLVLISVRHKVQSTRGFVLRLAGEVLRSGGVSAPTVRDGFGGRSL